MSFQWRKDGTPIASATNSILTITNVIQGNEGLYSVTVTNSNASLTSKSAELRVLTAQQLQSLTIFSGFARVSFGDPAGGSLTSNDLQHFKVESSSNLLDWQLYQRHVRDQWSRAVRRTNHNTATILSRLGALTSWPPPPVHTVIITSRHFV